MSQVRVEHRQQRHSRQRRGPDPTPPSIQLPAPAPAPPSKEDRDPDTGFLGGCMAGIGRRANALRGRAECKCCNLIFTYAELDSEGLCESCVAQKRSKNRDDGCCVVC
jgi:hypothetical protein